MFVINENSEYAKGLEKEKLLDRAEMHSFHRYYGKLIPAIPGYFIKEFTKEGDLVFDPFSGSGTVAVEAKRLKRNFLGAEINPLSAAMARVKTYSLDPKTLDKINEELTCRTDGDFSPVSQEERPYIMNRDHWFKDYVQEDLIRIKRNIDRYFAEHSEYSAEYKEFYLLTLSAIIKNVSNADTRHVFPGFSKRMHKLEEEGKIHTDVKASFKRAVKSRAKAYKIYNGINSEVKIIEGDSSVFDFCEYKDSADLIVTNPPYISSVRYIETLKLEMYWMQVIKSQKEYGSLAENMIGNDRLKKSECAVAEFTAYDEINSVIKDMFEIDPKSAKIIGEFFNKTEKVIAASAMILKKNKYLVMKISDSKMKKKKIPTGEFLTLIAQHHGFKLKDVFLDEINNNSRSLTTARNTYSDIITHDYIIIWEKL